MTTGAISTGSERDGARVRVRYATMMLFGFLLLPARRRRHRMIAGSCQGAREDVISLYTFIGWVLTLPEGLAVDYHRLLSELEETADMP